MESSIPAGSPQRLSASVLIIGDEPEISRVWAYTLNQAGLGVCLAGLSEKTLGIWSEEAPDLIIFEVQHPTPDVFAFCRQVRAEAALPILFLTTRNDEAHILEAYQAGVDECIPHPVSPRLLLAKVNAWLRRMQAAPVAALDEIEVAGFHLHAGMRLVHTPHYGPVKLTILEARLLHLLMSHAGWVLETDYLIERVWGHSGSDDGILLKNVVYRLRRKIEPDPGRPRYLLTEASLGYKFQPCNEGTGTAVEAAKPGAASTRAGKFAPVKAAGLAAASPASSAAQTSAGVFRPRHTGMLHPKHPAEGK